MTFTRTYRIIEVGRLKSDASRMTMLIGRLGDVVMSDPEYLSSQVGYCFLPPTYQLTYHPTPPFPPFPAPKLNCLFLRLFSVSLDNGVCGEGGGSVSSGLGHQEFRRVGGKSRFRGRSRGTPVDSDYGTSRLVHCPLEVGMMYDVSLPFQLPTTYKSSKLPVPGVASIPRSSLLTGRHPAVSHGRCHCCQSYIYGASRSTWPIKRNGRIMHLTFEVT